MPESCPFCGEPVYSITTRRLTPDVVACRTCGDKIIPIINAVANGLCNSITYKITEDPDATLSSILRGMIDEDLTLFMPISDEVRRRLEASL